MLRHALAACSALLLACSGSEAPTTGTDAASDAATGADSTASVDDADAAAADTATDPWDGGAPSAECVAHCACMNMHCTTFTGYPYKTAKDCTDHCGRFTAPEMKCWSYFCGEAAKMTPAKAEHWCQHAWGTWGLEECPT